MCERQKKEREREREESNNTKREGRGGTQQSSSKRTFSLGFDISRNFLLGRFSMCWVFLSLVLQIFKIKILDLKKKIKKKKFNKLLSLVQKLGSISYTHNRNTCLPKESELAIIIKSFFP
jgi:hypothetical protein